MELKALIEKRAALLEELEALTNKAVAETRAFTEQEKSEYDSKKAEIENLDATIKAVSEQRALTTKVNVPTEGETQEQAEKRAFESYIRTGTIETRSDINFTTTDNGAVIPAVAPLAGV